MRESLGNFNNFPEKKSAFLEIRYSGNVLFASVDTKATITRCDLSSRFFCIDATLLCEFESNKI